MITPATARILVVDDNRNMRYIVREMLKAAGMPRIAEAESAQSALSIASRFPIDLAIIDWQMAPVDGVELTKMIRNGAAGPNAETKILIMTAHTELARVAAARDAGVHGMLRKPITARLLLSRVSSALSDTRPFVRAGGFYGPDRRHGQTPCYEGPLRRASDASYDDDIVLDDAPLSAWNPRTAA
ncbi:MAG: response regulator [Caulobacterales bacterium]